MGAAACLPSARLTAFATGLVTALAGLTVVAGTPASADPPIPLPDTVLVSSSATGVPGNRAGDRPEISGNGRYVTFDSASSNLVPGVDTQQLRVYRKDLQTGEIVVISQSSTGVVSNTWNSFTWPDYTGNLVAFVSDSTDLTSTPGTQRGVYLRNVSAGTTELISVGTNGRGATGASSRPMLTRNGRFVAFSSTGANLTAAGGNGQEQVYLRDRQLGTTTLISVASAANGGGLGNARSYRGMVSEDGRYVAYASSATNQVDGTQVNGESIFLRDTVARTTTRISVLPNGKPGFGSRPYLSPDARYIVFNTYSPLVVDDTNGASDVYTFDRSTGVMSRTSTAVSGGDGSDEALRGFISDDARYFVFNSFSGNLTDDDTNGKGDSFIRDNTTGRTSRLSMSFTGAGADGQSFRPVPSSDGSVVTFLSEARNLIRKDVSTDYQVYAVTTAAVTAVTKDTTAPAATISTPASGATVIGTTIDLAGQFSDDRGVDSGFVQVRDDVSGNWLKPDGTWTATATRIPVNVASRFALSTAWSLTLTLPKGKYRFEARAFDTFANVSPSSGFVPFTMSDLPADTTPPTATGNTPAPGATVSTPSVELRGQFSDDRAVDRGFTQVRDEATGLWLRADGTWGASATRLPVTLATPGAATTAWSLTMPLPLGRFGFDAVAFDTNNNQSASSGFTTFTMADTTAPVAAVTAPVEGATIDATSAALAGTLTDDRGVTSGYVQVRRPASNDWLRADGSFGSTPVRLPVALASPGATSTGWSLSVALPNGGYEVQAGGADATGNSAGPSAPVAFTIASTASDTVPPTVSVTAPAAGATVTTPGVELRGALGDDRGVDRATLALQSTTTSQWLQTDGTWGATAAALPATLGSRGALTSTWSLPVTLPVGGYRFEVTAVDLAGNTATAPAVTFTSVDTTAPVVVVTAPADGASIPGGAVELRGQLSDDRAVTRGSIRLQDVATGLWLQGDGTWSSGRGAAPIVLANPGATVSTWSLALTLPVGGYRFTASGVDSSGNTSAASAVVSFTVPDTTAPSIATPAGGTVTGPAVTLSGSATDNVGVTKVYVQVRDNGTNLWLKADGTWGSTAVRLNAALGSSGAATTTWSYALNLPNGSYGFDVQSQDAAGNLSTKPWTTITVTSGAPDTTAPTVAVVAPTNKAVVAGPSVTLRGTGADNVGVTKAFVQLRDNATNLWLRADGTWGTGAIRLNAVLTDTGGGTWAWSLATSLPAGSYGFDIDLRDAAGNASTKPWTSFTVS